MDACISRSDVRAALFVAMVASRVSIRSEIEVASRLSGWVEKAAGAGELAIGGMGEGEEAVALF